jgi:peptidoglycan hydrolase CwlO-like protein
MIRIVYGAVGLVILWIIVQYLIPAIKSLFTTSTPTDSSISDLAKQADDITSKYKDVKKSVDVKDSEIKSVKSKLDNLNN